MIGKTISHYKITEKLGQGGMGIVYKAQDLNLDRFVALKFLPPHLTTNDDEKQRFIHEAKTASALQHNNICAIHEIDETEDGQIFICMDYYEGETLDDRIQKKPLPIEEAIDITIQIAQGLVKAHEKEIVHRDIKPANIMLTKEGVVKVLDFGLAKLSTQTKLTKESTTLGTVSYMSPEQAKGEEVDYRTDIWSLGIIIYEMLTGQLPFKGEYESAVIYSIMNDTQEPVTGLRTGVPMELERIINKCLQKSPADRYQHIDELIVDLKGLKNESNGIQTKEIKQRKRSKSVLLPVAILSIAILIITGYFVIPLNEKSGLEWENSIAVLPFTDLSPDRDQEWLSNGMTDQIISNIGRLSRIKVIPYQSMKKYNNTDKTIYEIGSELDVINVLVGSIQKFDKQIKITLNLIKTENEVQVWSEDYHGEYKAILDIQGEILEAIGIKLLATLSPQEKKIIKTNRPSSIEANEYYMKGRHFHYNKYMATFNKEYINTAERMLKTAIKLDPNFSDSYASLADLYNTLYNLPSDTIHTVHERDKLLKMQEAYLDTAITLNPKSSEVMNAKSFIHWAKGEIDEAFISAKRALAFNVNNDLSYSALGYFFRDLGLTKLSIKCYDRAIRLNPIYPKYYYSRSFAHINLGQMKRAEVDYHKVKEIAPNFPFLPNLYLYILLFKKKYTEAEKQLNKLTLSDEKIRLRALLYAGMGEKEKALNTYKEGNLILFSLLGMTKEAIAIMTNPEEMDDSRKTSVYDFFKNSPFYNNIRSTPEFQTMLNREKELYEHNLEKYGDIEGLLN